MNITRRHLLLAGTAAVCAGAAGTAYWELHDEDEDEPGAGPLQAATELLGDADGAPWLGEAYLGANPGITKQQVTRRMLGGRRKRPSTADELRRAIRRDYSAGRTVVVEGWYFAESEAAAAALVALSS